MNIYSKIEEYKSLGKSVVSLGFFDGVHLGHRAILKKTVEIGQREGIASIALTFDTHAGNVLAGKILVPLITDNTEKAYQISQSNVENLVFLSFCKELSELSPEQFVTDILIKRLNAAALVCGENYTFGNKKSGDVKLLAELCKKYGISLHVAEPVYQDGRLVSSSVIRKALEKGNMEKVTMFLGREYSLSARVESGKKLGRTIGIPTINQSFFDGSVIPSHGVYISRTCLGEAEYPSVSNVGVHPTVDNIARLNMETHIISEYFDLYDQWVRVVLVKKIRDEKKFGSLEELKNQIQKDIKKSGEYYFRTR